MNYTSDQIKTIDELIDHIRENVGMYIGESNTPLHLFEECFTNSIDEAIAGYCNIIGINIDEDNTYHIIDNGRGIPIENDVPLSISTKFSGAKFNKSKSAYKITCLHGSTKFLLDGPNMAISEMANSENEEFWGLSATEDGKFVANKLYAPQITGYTKQMVRVYLDNDKVEECTLDHLWMLSDGSYKQAIDLQSGDSLMPCYFGEYEDGHILNRLNYTYEYERNIRLERRGHNHKVIKTEIVNYDVEIPVYDIHSPNYNNFVLESGVVVHNSGKHGVGLVVVNALSVWYQIEIYRDDKYALFTFEEGKLVNKNIEGYEGKKPFSTKVSFKPNPEFFNKEKIPIDTIRSRALVASVEIPDCKLVVNNGDNREIVSYDKFDYFKDHCLNNDGNYTDIIHLSSNIKEESFETLFCWSKDGPLSQKILSSVNVLPVIDGGTHVNIFNEIVRDVLTEKGKKLGYRFQPLDTNVRLRAYISTYLLQPDFGAQSKDKLTNRKDYFNKLASKFRKEFENYLNNNQDLLDDLLKQFDSYRRSLDSKKLRGNNTGKRAATKLTKLKDCKSRNGELFTVEGDSAAGTVLDMRDPNIHAVLPLKGKIPSIVNKKEEIIKNNEIAELISALGTGYGPEFDITKLRYDKVICLTDSDPDGNHIASLLTIAIANLVPDIIKEGRYFIARTPLRAINNPKNGEFVPLWTKEDYDKAIKNKKPVTYFKGLGELDGWQLELCALNPDTRKLIQVSYSENISEIMELFSDVNKKRDLLENEEIGLLG